MMSFYYLYSVYQQRDTFIGKGTTDGAKNVFMYLINHVCPHKIIYATLFCSKTNLCIIYIQEVLNVCTRRQFPYYGPQKTGI